MNRPARSRRDFMRLLAAGSAAALVTPVAALAAESAKAAAAPAAKTRDAAAKTTPGAAPRQRRSRTDQPAARPALPEEIEKQKKYLADSLKRIRDYSLPPGSTPAFEFRPLASNRSRRAAR